MASSAGSWLAGGGNGAAVDVHSLLDETGAVKALCDMIEAGALCSIGTTSNGGALAVTITVDGEWRRDYFRTADELSVWLAEATPAVVELAEAARGGSTAASPSAGRGSRQRRR